MRTSTILCSLLLSSLALFAGCSKVCETDDLPNFSLTAGEKSWLTAYPQNAVLRFRNANGYERTYKVIEARVFTEDRGNVGKGAVCPSYQREFASVVLERTDTTGTNYFKRQQTFTQGATSDQEVYSGYIQWGVSTFYAPIKEVEAGQQTLASQTFAGRTYQSVLELSSGQPSASANSVQRIFLTKADGVIRFEERGGTVWNRL